MERAVLDGWAEEAATESWWLPCGVVVELVAHEPDPGVAALAFWWQGTVWLASVNEAVGEA